MKMLLLLGSLIFIVGCQHAEEDTMDLLDEEIKEIRIFESDGVSIKKKTED